MWPSFLDFSVVVLIYIRWRFCPVGINPPSCVMVFIGQIWYRVGLQKTLGYQNPLKFQVKKKALKSELGSGFYRKPNQWLISASLDRSFARAQHKLPPHRLWNSWRPDEIFAAASPGRVAVGHENASCSPRWDNELSKQIPALKSYLYKLGRALGSVLVTPEDSTGWFLRVFRRVT